MATATETRRGIAHRCPMCGADDSLRLSLADVAEMECGECSEGVTADDLRAAIAAYERLLAWLSTAPVRED